MGIAVWEGTLTTNEGFPVQARVRLRPAQQGEPGTGFYALQTRASGSPRWTDLDPRDIDPASLVSAIGRGARTPGAVIRHAAGWAADHPEHDDTCAPLIELARRVERGEVDASSLPEFASWGAVVVWAQGMGFLPADK